MLERIEETKSIQENELEESINRKLQQGKKNKDKVKTETEEKEKG